eukprot:7687380-Alexandrium_andersonii.AAC.1
MPESPRDHRRPMEGQAGPAPQVCPAAAEASASGPADRGRGDSRLRRCLLGPRRAAAPAEAPGGGRRHALPGHRRRGRERRRRDG